MVSLRSDDGATECEHVSAVFVEFWTKNVEFVCFHQLLGDLDGSRVPEFRQLQ